MSCLFLMLSIVLFLNHEVSSQIFGSTIGMLNQPLANAFIETPRYIKPNPRYTQQIIHPYEIQIPNVSKTVMDCTIPICKKLSNSIQLLVLTQLLENTFGGLTGRRIEGEKSRFSYSRPY